MKKKLFATIAVLCIFTCIALGSGSSSDSSKKDIVSSDASAVTDSGANEGQLTSSSSNESSAAVTIEEAVVYDANGIKITAKEYSTDSFWGDGIKFLIENDSSKNITVSTNATIVNNYMIADLFVESVAAGKKSNETLSLSTTALNAAGITNIGQIEVYFHIYDSDSYDAIADTDCILIKTNLYDSMDQTVDDSGVTLYDTNGIKIVGKYVNESSFWGKAVMLYCENNTDKNVTISADDLSVNGFMVTSLFSKTIYAGKKAYADITLLSTDLEENGITSVDDIALKFRIYNPDTYNTIAETDEIKFSTK